MNMMTINPEVFNSAVNYNKHEKDALDASIELKNFLVKLANAANHSKQPPFADFTIVPFTLSAEMSGGLKDYLILCQNFEEIIPEPPEVKTAPTHNNINAKPGETAEQEVTPSISNNAPVITLTHQSTIDFSFGVFKDGFHVMRAGIKVRQDTAVDTDPDTGHMNIRRKIASGSMKAADQVEDFATSLFSWMHDQMPKKDRAEFMRRCKEEGLVPENTIGFKRPAALQSEKSPELSAA